MRRETIQSTLERHIDTRIVLFAAPAGFGKSTTMASKAKKLFFYPTNFEGGECNRYFVATGPIPMQQVDPMMPWVAENLGKTIYIMASDYAWPQKMTEAITAAYEKAGGKIVGADYYPFGTTDFGPAFSRTTRLSLSLTAVSSSWLFIMKPPSPQMAMIRRCG